MELGVLCQRREEDSTPNDHPFPLGGFACTVFLCVVFFSCCGFHLGEVRSIPYCMGNRGVGCKPVKRSHVILMSDAPGGYSRVLNWPQGVFVLFYFFQQHLCIRYFGGGTLEGHPYAVLVGGR